MIVSLLAALLFYMVPLGVGAALAPSTWRRLPDRWILGNVVLIGLVAILSLAPGPAFAWTVRLAVTGLLARGLHRFWNTRASETAGGGTGIPHAVWVAAVASSMAALFVHRSWSPYPAVLNWDMLEHLTVSRAMAQGEWHARLGAYTDTFTLEPYLPAYHTLLAIPQILLPSLDPSGYFYFLDSLHRVAMTGAVAFLAFQATSRVSVAVWAALTSSFIFESFVAYAGFFHMPQNLAGLFFAVALGYAVGPARPSTGRLTLWAAFLVSMHFLVGPAGAFLVIVISHRLARPEKDPAFESRISLAINAVLIGLILLTVWKFDSLRFDPFGTAESASFNLPLLERFGWFTRWFGFGHLAMVVPVIWCAHRGSRAMRALGQTALLFVWATLAPVPYTLKFLALGHAVIAAVTGLALHSILSEIRPGAWRWLCAAVYLYTLAILLAANDRLVFQQWMRSEGVASLISSGEREAAAFLTRRYGFRGGYVVSDPATQYVLEGLSGVESQGGAYANLTTRKALMAVRADGPAEIAARAVWSITDEIPGRSVGPRLLALSGRFFSWQAASERDRQSPAFNVWRPRALTREEAKVTRGLTRSPLFHLVFENESLALFEVMRPLDPPAPDH